MLNIFLKIFPFAGKSHVKKLGIKKGMKEENLYKSLFYFNDKRNKLCFQIFAFRAFILGYGTRYCSMRNTLAAKRFYKSKAKN